MRAARALALGLALCTGVVHAQVSLRDDLGRLLQVKGPGTRIITLAPFLTELVYAAGAGSRVVGVSDLSAFPPEAKPLATIATGANFSMEQIARLKPDLVFAWRDGIRRDDVDQMTAFGATVFVAQGRQLEDVPRLLRSIGLLTGQDVAPVIERYEGKLEALRRANAMKPKLGIFLEVQNRPLTTVSGSHFMSEALEVCRGENVFKDLSGVLPRVSWDEVEVRNPYVIVGAGSASSAEEFRANWNLRRVIPAVQEDRLIFLGAETMQRPTMRILDGIEQLCQDLDRMRPASAPAAPVPPPARAATAPAPPPARAATAHPPPAPEPPRPGERPSQYGL